VNNTYLFQLLKGRFFNRELGRRKVVGTGGHGQASGMNRMRCGMGSLRSVGSVGGSDSGKLFEDVGNIRGKCRRKGNRGSGGRERRERRWGRRGKTGLIRQGIRGRKNDTPVWKSIFAL
jgi:hypothetical protein